MGADQSKSDDKPRTNQQGAPRGVSRDEVNLSLEQQKRDYERKLKELQTRTAAAHPVQQASQQGAPRGVSRDEVNLLLEQQKRDYERKLRELQIRTAAAHPVQQAREVTERNVDQILGQQLQEFVQIAFNNTSPSTTGTQRLSGQQTNIRASQPSTSGIGRNDNASGYTNPTQNQIYPKLDSVNDNVTSGTYFRPQANRNESLQTHSSCNSNSFIFVDKKNGVPNCRPTAPPQPLPSTRINCSPAGELHPSTWRPSTSSRSQSNKREDNNLNCITCGNKYGLNIFQCPLGHSSCKDCKIRSVSCGICRKPIGDTRNITLEAYVAEVTQAACKLEKKVLCPNSSDGCNLFLKEKDIEIHMKECPFKEFACPLNSHDREPLQGICLPYRCNWRGKLTQMASHFDDVHPENRQGNVDTEMHLINIFDNNQTIHFIDISPFKFLVYLKVDDEQRKILMTVQYLGTQISASKWTYEVHIYNKREPRRKYVYSDVCNSIVIPVEEIFTESKCMSIPQSYAMTFINEGSLTYKFYIKKGCESAPFRVFRGRGRGRGRGLKSQ